MAPETPSSPESTDDAARGRTRRRLRLPGLPLWLLGILEAFQVVLTTVLLVVLPVLAITLGGGFSEFDLEFIAQLSAQIWLIVHGTPVELVITLDEGALGEGLAIPDGGWFHLVPMGLTLIPLVLGWRAGRRLAQGSYTNQLWQGLLTLVVGYAAAGAGLSQLAGAEGFDVEPHWAGLCAAVVILVGSLGGCYAEARSWVRLIGVDVETRVEELSQQLRWAGYYAWAIVRAGAVVFVAAVGLGSVLLAGQLVVSWMDMVNVFQQLDPGMWGILGITALHLGLAPNLVLWTVAYSTGAGFSVGTGTTVAPYAVELGQVPAIPILGAAPEQPGEAALTVLLLPVLAGVVGGWWFMREGENHLDDWFALRIPARPLSLGLSTIALGVLIGLVTALLAVGPLWLSHISLGVGRMTDVGPDPLISAGMLGAWAGLGSIIGYLIAPAAHQLRRRRRVPDPTPDQDQEDHRDQDENEDQDQSDGDEEESFGGQVSPEQDRRPEKKLTELFGERSQRASTPRRSIPRVSSPRRSNPGRPLRRD